uniref:Coiled-coil domain-containing protein 124 n=1 Tax=Lygus hesperus TaxID=30085 RepID=A0A0A9XE38_LYGHE
MPKKFASENTKAVAARERKATAKELEKKKKQQAEEDAYWEDDDKSVKKKQQRKEAAEQKKLEQLQKKAEAKALLEDEVGSVLNVRKQAVSKVTRSQIEEEKERRQAAAMSASAKPKVETHLSKPLEENINRLVVEGEEARSVDDAIRVLSLNPDAEDKHPERRMKAAYNAYEEKMLPVLKQENPGLRLSQLKQMIFKQWQTSPENPLVAARS